ncbi:putative RNA 2'-phosphotransferase [Rhizocola hellebori]|uniref:Probable RNA 2'-phosphotransferase n=1 Tax=Rhizocola hellebori TaxID=1392758 RepID=A0A8J3QGM3_9ACTN|nr:RNA 2'-phosphotransferase [Rhizocola hellebori]GIH10739.1 putative RNA 2'-phosphotransferase [Rhizocola hellebori]
MDPVKASKRLAYVLRHGPDSIGITLSPDGWVDIDVLLKAMASHGLRLDRDQLMAVVGGSDKQRFAVQENRIRANQGHSVEVELGYAPCAPPEVLYHGTASRNLSSIFAKGLVRGDRHHVHLSPDMDTARKAGARHGFPVVLQINTKDMLSVGYQFFVSDNGVWLTAEVPPEFLITLET